MRLDCSPIVTVSSLMLLTLSEMVEVIHCTICSTAHSTSQKCCTPPTNPNPNPKRNDTYTDIGEIREERYQTNCYQTRCFTDLYVTNYSFCITTSTCDLSWDISSVTGHVVTVTFVCIERDGFVPLCTTDVVGVVSSLVWNLGATRYHEDCFFY